MSNFTRNSLGLYNGQLRQIQILDNKIYLSAINDSLNYPIDLYRYNTITNTTEVYAKGAPTYSIAVTSQYVYTVNTDNSPPSDISYGQIFRSNIGELNTNNTIKFNTSGTNYYGQTMIALLYNSLTSNLIGFFSLLKNSYVVMTESGNTLTYITKTYNTDISDPTYNKTISSVCIINGTLFILYEDATYIDMITLSDNIANPATGRSSFSLSFLPTTPVGATRTARGIFFKNDYIYVGIIDTTGSTTTSAIYSIVTTGGPPSVSYKYTGYNNDLLIEPITSIVVDDNNIYYSSASDFVSLFSMPLYKFNIITPTTPAKSYLDLQSLGSTIYTASKTSPYIQEINYGTITSFSTSVQLSILNCITVLNSTTIYCSNNSGTIYKVIKNGVVTTEFAIGGVSIKSMAINRTPPNLLYLASSTTIYVMRTLTPITFNTLLSTTFPSITSIKFYNDKLYVACVNNVYIITALTTTPVATRVITNCPQTIYGIAINSTGLIFVRTRTTTTTYDKNIYQVKETGQNTGLYTLVEISTDLPTTSLDNTIIFDSTDFLYSTNITNSDTSVGDVYSSTTPLCFNKGTKILCLNQELFDDYVPIEQLQLGDYVKTYKHGYRKIIKIIKGSFKNNPKKWNMCMYKMTKTKSNRLIEDLIVTGGHSILVDSITKQQQAKYDEMGISEFSKETIDGKHLLLACVSDQFAPMPDNKVYTYYHLLLNNDNDEEERFGIWANGILTETPNEKTLQ
jgi:hypothetical protein